MHTGFKKLLTSALMLAIIVLPFRMAFSMSLDSFEGATGQHCKDTAMASMSQNGQAQLLDAHEVVVDSSSQGDCCDMSNSDCTGCVHVTAVYFDFLQFSDLPGNEVFSETLLPFTTRVISPPSRPPLILYV